jgi:hypothetical protein
MHILLFFIDGLGLGTKDPVTNPLVTAQMPTIRKLLNGQPLTGELGRMATDLAILLPTDAILDVPGMPQSATGQTALFTGINAPALLGTHLHAFPTQRLREVIAEHSVLKQVKQIGGRVTSANAYRPDYLELAAERRWRHAASTLAVLAAGIPLNLSLERLNAGETVYQDLTNNYLQEFGYTVSSITAQQAGINLAKIVMNHHFTLFEYFQTDRAGHKQDRLRAEKILENIDSCLGSLLTSVDLNETMVIVCSDHGNIEDLSVKVHTCNPVPTILIGAGKEFMASRIEAITDITPGIVELMKLSLLTGKDA